MLCPRCNAPADTQSRFCIHCGATIGRVIRIGRDDSPGVNDVVVEHFGQVSRQHAEVVVEADRLEIRDLRSSNGTFVNGRRVGPMAEPFRLTDEIRFGSYVFNTSQLVPWIEQARGARSAPRVPAYNPQPPMPVPVVQSSPYGDRPMPGPTPGWPVPYAGFWLRFVAYVIDSLVLSVLGGVLTLLVAALTGLSLASMDFGLFGAVEAIFSALAHMFLVVPLLLVSTWLYFAMMESSSSQGTLGKMALGLRVTDLNGRPINFGRATGRFFSKIITSLIPFGIGYIVAGFSSRKQAIHDMIASCLVLRRAP